LAHLDNIKEEGQLQGVIGRECFPGQVALLFAWIIKFKSDVLPLASTILAAETRKKAKITHPQHIQHSNKEENRIASPKQPTKRALAAENSCCIALEKKEKKQVNEEMAKKRRDQIAEILRD
jgi:hypothetical protein